MQKSSWLRGKIAFVLILVITIGVCFRFANLDRKVYWGDEVYSSLRIFGYTTEQMHREIAIGKPVKADVLQQFQSRSPEHGIAETVQVLVQEDSHLTPLYFVLARLWANWFGDSTVAMRSFSVVLSVIMLPSLYWLAMELFGNSAIAVTSVVLATISPVQLIFAQEARFYSLWILTTVLSSATLLRALRINTWVSWGQFTIALIANLYAQFLAVLTLGGYAVYVLITTLLQPSIFHQDLSTQGLSTQGLSTQDLSKNGEKRRNWSALFRFAIAAGVGFMTLVPWLWIFLHREADDTDDSLGKAKTIAKAAKNLFVVFSRGFIDFNWNRHASSPQLILLGILTLICLGLVLAAMRRLFQETTLRSSLFVIILLMSSLLPLLPMSLKDALPARYLLPSYLALELALAYLLGTNLQNPQACRPRWLWSAATVFLVILGLLSCGSIVRAEDWWVKQYSSCNHDVAQLVNRAAKPLVISDGNGVRTFDHAMSNVVSLARLVKPETRFQVFLEKELPESIPIADGFSDRFLLTPSKALFAKLNAQYPGQLHPEVDGSDNGYRNGQAYCLWRLPATDPA
jgi:uncharacterized membrane protein